MRFGEVVPSLIEINCLAVDILVLAEVHTLPDKSRKGISHCKVLPFNIGSADNTIRFHSQPFPHLILIAKNHPLETINNLTFLSLLDNLRIFQVRKRNKSGFWWAPNATIFRYFNPAVHSKKPLLEWVPIVRDIYRKRTVFVSLILNVPEKCLGGIRISWTFFVADQQPGISIHCCQ
jgi:hypothetical protein